MMKFGNQLSLKEMTHNPTQHGKWDLSWICPDVPPCILSSPNKSSHRERRIFGKSLYTPQSGYLILTQCLSLFHSVSWPSSGYHLSSLFLLHLFSLVSPPSVSSFCEGHLEMCYAQGMFTSLNDWWEVMFHAATDRTHTSAFRVSSTAVLCYNKYVQ